MKKFVLLQQQNHMEEGALDGVFQFPLVRASHLKAPVAHLAHPLSFATLALGNKGKSGALNESSTSDEALKKVNII